MRVFVRASCPVRSATANGYIGMRGNFEEGSPVAQSGTYVNGFYESWPITYGEEAYGFAKTGQTMLNVTDTKIMRLYVDDEPFHLPTANLLKFERVLDMRAGRTVSRSSSIRRPRKHTRAASRSYV